MILFWVEHRAHSAGAERDLGTTMTVYPIRTTTNNLGVQFFHPSGTANFKLDFLF